MIKILIANQMIIAEKLTGNQAILNPETGEIYLSTGEGVIPLLSKNEYYPLTHFNQKNMLSVSDLLNSENNGILREINGLTTDNLQEEQQKINGQSTEIAQTIYRKNTKDLRKLDRSLTELRAKEIIENYNLKLFSHNFTGTIKNLSEQIENLTIAILYNSNKKKTIEKTRIAFSKAADLAAKNKDIELEKIHATLTARRAGQLKIEKMNKTINKKANSKRMKILVLISILILAAIFAIIKQITIAYSTTPEIENTILTEEIILNKISDFEQTNQTKVYAWRKKKIINELKGTELSQKQINDTLNYLIYKKWMKK